jgi:hypothetical protein
MPFTVALPRLTAGRVAIVVILSIVLLLALYGKPLAPRIWKLNAMLQDDPVLAAYPYEFRVVIFLNGIATLTRPYTDTSDPRVFLTHINPALAGLRLDDPAMRRAEQALKDQEDRAIGLLLDQPDVESVNWLLDQAWYNRNQVPLPAGVELGSGL